MNKKLVEISKIHKLISMIQELQIKNTEVMELVRYIEYEILEEDKQNINEVKRMYYKNMMTAKEKGDTETYQYWYEQYQNLKTITKD